MSRKWKKYENVQSHTYIQVQGMKSSTEKMKTKNISVKNYTKNIFKNIKNKYRAENSTIKYPDSLIH
jgi:hypothetical protein